MQLCSCEPLLILVVAKEDSAYINSPIPVHKVISTWTLVTTLKC